MKTQIYAAPAVKGLTLYMMYIPGIPTGLKLRSHIFGSAKRFVDTRSVVDLLFVYYVHATQPSFPAPVSQ